MKVLYTTEDTHAALKDLFVDGGVRRVAVVAFVGKDAEKYLLSPRGAEVYCWPRAGGTHPDAIEELLALGAKVYFSDRLHMKLYWAEGKGAIVTSANLTNNALGAGGLKELGVAVSSTDVDIDAIIDAIQGRPVTPDALATLRLEHDAYYAADRSGQTGLDGEVTFLDWFNSRTRKPWQISWYDDNEEGTLCKAARKIVSNERPGHEEPHDSVYCSKDELKPKAWALALLVSGRVPKSPSWVFVNHVVSFGTSERGRDPEWPYQAIQVQPPDHCPPPPFVIDKAFRSALKALAQESPGSEFNEGLKTSKTNRLPETVLRRLAEHYAAAKADS